ncbi:MAG TPA: tetratricopeptide repeat protein, partial [Candidatus Eisenbacteria bacterium]|nr:tetratricopeptide repeat protein [Candidatus Eisenbacteria bacterium]
VADAERCAARAEAMRPGVVAEFESQGRTAAGPSDGHASGGGFGPEPGMLKAPAIDSVSFADLETDRPPRFVPPTDALPAMELDGHAAPAEDAVTPVPSLSVVPLFGDGAAAEDKTDIESVERLLGLAQTEFRAGNHASAAKILARAAHAYESLDRWDDAVAIHRSLCKSPHATTEMIERWLGNCEHRKDRSEAARVACELGDRAIQGDDLATAETWFRRALELDVHNTVASRRLERLGHSVPAAVLPAPVVAPPVYEEPLPAPENGGDGKVEVAVDRGQAVTFDFASMLAEFQRGVQTQLSGDAQAHYDLAMAYREMGLIEQAVESFRLSAQDPRFRQRCAEMIGHCLLEEGRFEEAAQELTMALAHTGLEPEHSVGIRYELGLALEAAGHAHEALSEFERVFEIEANYPDVAAKIRDLRKNLEAA